ncbi:MAG: metallophosphoesterase family protein [Ardenticatenaceae bacterium]|nr:metallophosphoesterase family protein [Ardenticatenaceae bacterium]
MKKKLKSCWFFKHAAGRWVLYWASIAAFLTVGTPNLTAIQQGSADPDQIHLAWVDDPATSLTAVWRTLDPATPSELQVRPAGTTAWQTIFGGQRPSGTTGVLHEVAISGLIAATTYEYRVRGDNGVWSDIYTTRTAPTSGPFEAIYVADTGLTGRTDGLATGTAQVVDEIAALNPLLVLPGGDYAYFNTEGDRFASLNGAIDAWFNQMQPVAARAPLMPTYGNHEVLLGENVEDWLQRFPTPSGYDGRRYYSFDIADAHFISIFAPQKIADPAALTWIEQDIVAAKAAGQKWVIPYFHVAPFADGTNHSSSQSLRNALGPIFERHNIPLVLTSHDQAYERTWPLTDAAGATAPTTTSHRGCIPESEGVTWVKVSPGGKLSNISWGFSPFGSEPPPEWSSVRSHALHVFARLIFTGEGNLRVEILGVNGDGSAPAVIDTFLLTDSCPDELLIDRAILDIHLFADETAGFEVDVTSGSGVTTTVDIHSDQPWLQPLSSSATTPAAVSFQVNPAALTPGIYTAAVDFTPISGSLLPGRMVVNLTVRGNTGAYTLWVSRWPDRSDPKPLHDQYLSGPAYIFTQPDTSDIGQVRFLIDDRKERREGNPPFDLAGSFRGQANPYDSLNLEEGGHTLTAVVVKEDGRVETAAARFRVNNIPVAVTYQGEEIRPSRSEFVPLFFLLTVLSAGLLVTLWWRSAQTGR